MIYKEKSVQMDWLFFYTLDNLYPYMYIMHIPHMV